MLNAADLPDDITALKAMLIAATARETRKDERIERLERLVAAFRQAAFGRKSEKVDPDQFDLALEDLETAIAVVQAEDEADAPAGNRVSRPHATNRGSLPGHLPRIEELIEPASLVCACGGCLHCIGEDQSERLDVIPAQFRVIVTCGASGRDNHMFIEAVLWIMRTGSPWRDLPEVSGNGTGSFRASATEATRASGGASSW